MLGEENGVGARWRFYMKGERMGGARDSSGAAGRRLDGRGRQTGG